MKLIHSVLILTSFLALACATTHEGHEGLMLGEGRHLPARVSATTVNGNASDAFQLIEVTIENTSADWLRINSSQVVINDSGDSKLSVVTGKDLSDWSSAMSARIRMQQHNNELAQAGLIAVGVAATVTGNNSTNRSLAELGAVTVGVGSAWALTDAMTNSYGAAQRVNKVPENHLYQPFSVPGKMFLRRWVLLNKPISLVVSKLVLELETVEGEKNTYEISL